MSSGPRTGSRWSCDLSGAGRARRLARGPRGAARGGGRDRTRMRGEPGVPLLAVGLDLVAGEPPDRWHPVAWIGRALGAIERRLAPRTVARGGAAGLGLAPGGAGGGGGGRRRG